MVIDNTSTNPIKYVDSTLYVSGKGPNRWVAPVTIAHQELWGPAVHGMNRGPITSEEKPEPAPVGVTYVKCQSTDEGALLVIADGVEPVGKQISISTVTATGLTDVAVGDYVKVVVI